MERWEYFTTFIEANMSNAGVANSPEIPPGDHPAYSPFALIPELNGLGAKGWELIHMAPVKIGRNHDVTMPDASNLNWGRHYFCVFKRRTDAF